MSSFTSLSMCCVLLSQRPAVTCNHLSYPSIYIRYVLYIIMCCNSLFIVLLLFPCIIIFVPDRKSLAISLSVCVLIRAAKTCCMDEPASGPHPAVVWLLNALQGKMQQIEAQFPIMLFKPAVVSVQRNYESCNTFCISFFFFFQSLLTF